MTTSKPSCGRAALSEYTRFLPGGSRPPPHPKDQRPVPWAAVAGEAFVVLAPSSSPPCRRALSLGTSAPRRRIRGTYSRPGWTTPPDPVSVPDIRRRNQDAPATCPRCPCSIYIAYVSDSVGETSCRLRYASPCCLAASSARCESTRPDHRGCALDATTCHVTLAQRPTRRAKHRRHWASAVAGTHLAD